VQTKSGMVFLIALGAHCAALANSSFPITDVALYPGSATVARTVHATVGMNQLEIKDLPANFDVQTLRVQAEPGIRIGQVVTQDVGKAAAAGTHEAEIEAKIQALEDKQAALDVDAKSAALVQHYLERLNGAAAGDRSQAYVDAKSMAAVIETIRRSASDSFDRIQKVEIQKREIGESIKALQRDLEHVRSGTRDVRNITINLAVQQAGAVRVSYQINGAGWKPGYRASLDSGASSLELERLATVSQKTGEDWSGVSLRLSTGQPRLSPSAPDPSPWLVTYHKPVPTAAYAVQAPAPVTAMKAFAARAAPGEASDAYQAPMLEEQSTFSTEFEVPARVTLPADGREISVALSKLAIAVKQWVRVAPRIDKAGVVTAEAERPAGVWPSGDMQLYRDGNYVGRSHWDAQASDRLVLSFGRDDLLNVTVNRSQQQTGTTGLLSQHAERHVADTYILKSFHKAPIDILVLEATPVSTSEEVKVQPAFEPKPTIENWEHRQGVVGWEKTLAPNEAMSIAVDYEIAYPKDGWTSGLP
jgi:uncharacterized protein (TIGR02231 family)